MEATVVIEKTETGYSAYVPALPGCVAAADSQGEVGKLFDEAIVFHLDSLWAHGDSIPEPRALPTTVQM